MPNITETISLLDELKRMLDNGLIGDEFDDAVWAFVKEYDSTLRQAALDGERYRKAGEAGRKLAESLDKLEDFSVEHWQRAVKKRLTAYRQAVEQKEV